MEDPAPALSPTPRHVKASSIALFPDTKLCTVERATQTASHRSYLQTSLGGANAIAFKPALRTPPSRKCRSPPQVGHLRPMRHAPEVSATRRPDQTQPHFHHPCAHPPVRRHGTSDN